ncbi:hypothetical protein Cgig2_016365 [Carnegiea gigantea]|uniref:PB1-like domain-containing protein n=1 Tax=Carnegiea gigantea TaxID=171969 RepID=A0A9Q1JXK1_9CARY|nr:hypothetical protein Cgig2_016365 [Carnegiea gigantea]
MAFTGREQGRLIEKGACKIYGRYGHEETVCYEVIGYPPGWGSRGRGKGGRGGRGQGRGPSRGGRTGPARETAAAAIPVGSQSIPLEALSPARDMHEVSMSADQAVDTPSQPLGLDDGRGPLGATARGSLAADHSTGQLASQQHEPEPSPLETLAPGSPASWSRCQPASPLPSPPAQSAPVPQPTTRPGPSAPLVEIHHGGKFVDGDKVEYVEGRVSEIEPVDIDRLSRFAIIGLTKEIGFTNVEKFYYLIPEMSLREGLRTCHNDFESLDMAAIAAVNKRLVVYLVHMVDVPKEVVLKMPALPCSSTATQQSNVDPMSSNFNDGQECDQKGGLDGSTSTFGSENSRGTRVKHTPTKSPFSMKKQKDKLIEGESLNEESDDSEYVLETEVDLEAFEDIAGRISKARGKRKINVGGGVDDDGCEIDSDEHDWDTDIEDEWEADVEDMETSDEEWVAATAKVGECKKQKGSGKIDNAQQVGKQDMTVDKSSTSGIKQTQLGSSFHSNYETSEAEMDTDGETDGDVPRLLRKKEKTIKVDEHTDFKKLKWQVGMTFGTVQGFKDQYQAKKDYGVVINKWTTYKAKQAAYGMLHDSMFDHYSKLGRYTEELGRSNPDQGNNMSFSVSQGSKEKQLLEVEEEVEAGEMCMLEA